MVHHQMVICRNTAIVTSRLSVLSLIFYFQKSKTDIGLNVQLEKISSAGLIVVQHDYFTVLSTYW
jgi:hypothetical protein